MRFLLTSALLCCLPAAARGQDVQTLELKYTAMSRWEWDLPTEVWQPLGDALDLAGHRFEVSVVDGGLEVDSDGNGRPDSKVRGDQGHLVLEAEDADGEFSYAIRVRRLGEQWQWAPGGGLQGKLGDQTITVIDLDGDGRHCRFGVDGLVVGRKAPAGLLSSVVSIEGALWTFSMSEAPSGCSAELAPYAGDVALLDVVSAFESTGDLVSALFRSGTVCLDAAATGKPLLVPAGTYELVVARVARGARTARIRMGDLRAIELAAGQEFSLTWGGPLRAEFTYQVSEGELVVHPNVRFYGAGGAEYFDFLPVVSAPMIYARNAETNNLLNYGRFGGCCGGGYSAWKGAVPADAKLIVELEHKRHLFGEIRGVGRRVDEQER